jgi:hypothetical protein
MKGSFEGGRVQYPVRCKITTKSIKHRVSWLHLLECEISFNTSYLQICFYGIRRFVAGLTKSPPPIPMLSQMNPVQIPSLHSRSILILSSHLRLLLARSLSPLGLSIKILQAIFISPMPARCPSHLTLVDLLEEYKRGDHQQVSSSALALPLS